MSADAEQGQFEAYEAKVVRYGYEWFRSDDAAIDILNRLPEVRVRVDRLALGSQTVGTEVLYRSGGRWRSERLRVHDAAVREALRMGGLDTNGSGPDRLRHAVVLLGLPGSGKSSMLRPVAELVIKRLAHHAGVILDTDNVRCLLPEYADGLGSEVVHPETSYLANRLLVERAANLGLNLILDQVGHPERTLTDVQFLQEEGWSVWCLGAQIDVEVAVERVKRRALHCGRYVPPNLVRELGDRPFQTYEALRDSTLHLSGCALLSTDVPAGTPPLVIHANPEDRFGGPGSEVALWPGR
jgi:chloramphenicol 3-O-phosphotransferase